MRTQRVAADYFAVNGFPFAESTGAGRSGSDITGMPGLACEVKARSGFDPMAWLKQAEANAGLPFVIFRPNGMGEAQVGKWGVVLRLEVLTELLLDAGFGSRESATEDDPDAVDDHPHKADDERGDQGEDHEGHQPLEEVHRLPKGRKQLTQHEDKATPGCTSDGSSQEVGA